MQTSECTTTVEKRVIRMKILMMGTSNLLPGNTAWRCLADHSLEFADYNAWSRIFLGGESLPANVDLITWVVCLEDLFPATLITDLESSEMGADERLAQEVAGLTQPLESFLQDSSAVQIVVAWSYRERASAVRWAEHVPGWSQVSRLWESRLRELQLQSSRLLEMPLRDLFASPGLDRCMDARNLYFAHCHFSSQGLGVLARGIAAVAERLTQPAKKVLVLDCDNTLWGGVVGEDGLDGIRLGEDGIGRAFQAFQESVRYWMNQGVSLTLASKNNEADVWEVFDKHQAMRLRQGDLVAWRVNWSEKSSNLEEMAEDLGLGLDSLLFWDDNPMEREKMRQNLPQVCVPEVPADVTLWPEMLLNLPELQRFRVTAEDRRKRSQYAARAQFRAEKAATGDESAFLRSLQCRACALPLASPVMARAEQLCAKTNQFNLRSRRHVAAALELMARDPCTTAFVANLTDRFGDHGQVGLVIVRRSSIPEFAFLDTFLISCRVLGRCLESWMLGQSRDVLKAQGVRYLAAEYIPTARNVLVKDFLPSRGFQSWPPPGGAVPAEIRPTEPTSQLYWGELDHLTIPGLEYYRAEP